MSALTDRIAGVAAARGIPDQVVIDALIKAVKASIAKAYGADLDVEVGFDSEGSLEAYAFKEILPDNQSLTNPHKQIRLAKARKSLPDLDVGDEYGEPVDVAALERKALEPGRLEKLFERYGNGRKEKRTAEPQNTEYPTAEVDDGLTASPLHRSTGGLPSAPTSPPILPPRPPVEIIETKPGIFREVPWKDNRTRAEIVADLQREVDEWRDSMVSQFMEKIDEYATNLRSLIEEQVK